MVFISKCMFPFVRRTTSVIRRPIQIFSLLWISYVMFPFISLRQPTSDHAIRQPIFSIIGGKKSDVGREIYIATS